jgi:nitroimidazol reductase NimA-like FMN-containing flavoprotein (pyridoxamine 5'-phosphate oxidase superfamily)
MTENPTGPNELYDLERGECLSLLARGLVGRVVFTDGALPAAQPVVYRLDDEEVVFRTRNGSKLAAAMRHAVVAFEVDEVDVRTRSGWSVLGIGEAYEIVDPVRLAELAGTEAEVWVPGHDAHTIAIPLQIVTGRRLGAEA